VGEAFAKQLEDKMGCKTLPSILSEDLHREIDKLTVTHYAAPASTKVDLDKQGTRLWNLASKLTSKVDDGEVLCCSESPSSLGFSNRTHQHSTCFRLPASRLCTAMLTSPDHLK